MSRILLFMLAPLALMGCATEGAADAEAACRAQGYDPGTEAWRVCIDADGAPIATGPGSPYAKPNSMGPDD
ncbi:MAG TPA: hypothetical protein VK090_00985 [Paracoccaceae bacterium]|nr:hypothetical protein [Paracoccaceae bacterium]